MGMIRNRLTRRFPAVGLISDLALVGAAANRLLQRRNGTAGACATGSPMELALAGGAAFRLLQRLRRRRQRRRAQIVVIDE
ncbi:MAG: hypothetical protein AAF547_05620 [Actinomycetota bacterium]